MRLVVCSLIDDWDLGERLAQRGHEIVGWVRRDWNREPTRNAIYSAIRTVLRPILSRSKPPSSVPTRYDLRTWLDKNQVPQISVASVNDPSFITWLSDQKVDLLIVAVFPQILKAPVLNTPRLGVVNYHPSLLPQYAGAQPVFWMVKNGEKEAGITVHVMVEKIDAGGILGQKVIEIRDEENAGQLVQRMHHAAAILLADVVTEYGKGAIRPNPQDLSKRSYQGKRKDQDKVLDWRNTASQIVNLLCALQPSEPLRARYKGREIDIFEARPIAAGESGAKPGQILRKGFGRLTVKAGGEGSVEIVKYEIRPFHGWMNTLAQSFLMKIGAEFDEIEVMGDQLASSTPMAKPAV